MFDKETIKIIIDVADKYDYNAASLLAIVDTESAGQAFWTVNGKPKPAIRFEGHYFYARLNTADRAKAIEQGLASPKPGGVKNPTSFAARYTLLARAEKINATAARESTSWGLGQVMGANWQALGYGSVDDLVAAAQTIEGQVDMMVRFLENADLREAIQKHDWNKVARVYNGANYKKNQYHIKMAEAYEKYSKLDVGSMEEPSVQVPSVEEVIQLQKMLNTVGSYGLEEDGLLGTKTKTALRDFQLKNALKVDGLYGPITKSELEKIYLTKTNQTTQNIGIGGSTITTIGIAISEAAKQIEPLAKISQIAQWVFLGLLVVGVLITLKSTIFSNKR